MKSTAVKRRKLLLRLSVLVAQIKYQLYVSKIVVRFFFIHEVINQLLNPLFPADSRDFTKLSKKSMRVASGL